MADLTAMLDRLRDSYADARTAERETSEAVLAAVREALPGLSWRAVTGDGHVEARWQRDGWHAVSVGYDRAGWWASADHAAPPSSRERVRTLSVRGKRDPWDALYGLHVEVGTAGLRARSVDVTHDLSVLDDALRSILCHAVKQRREATHG